MAEAMSIDFHTLYNNSLPLKPFYSQVDNKQVSCQFRNWGGLPDGSIRRAQQWEGGGGPDGGQGVYEKMSDEGEEVK